MKFLVDDEENQAVIEASGFLEAGREFKKIYPKDSKRTIYIVSTKENQ